MEGEEQSQMKPNSDQALRKQIEVASLSSCVRVLSLTSRLWTLEERKRFESDTKITGSRPTHCRFGRSAPEEEI